MNKYKLSMVENQTEMEYYCCFFSRGRGKVSPRMLASLEREEGM